MYIYHGSEFIIEHPKYKGGRPNNDYGYGFYCTENPDMAREWSVTSDHNGYLNKYIFDSSELSTLDLSSYPALTWLAILLENRIFDITTPLSAEAKKYIKKEFLIDYEKYDVIKGYRADDSYFSFAQDFISGAISYEQLCEAMHLGKLGEQLVLKSKRSFECIKWCDSEIVPREIWLPLREGRDKKARKKYFSVDKQTYVKGALYITKILDEEIKNDDTRLR
ncbi:MAG: DUF3990 domain-containing protein [Lachnospiraceae bacterium]|nr:DUF3990 domain-containing protein [Lachnospiraceae bacterium]